jgi:hypothetical protein
VFTLSYLAPAESPPQKLGTIVGKFALNNNPKETKMIRKTVNGNEVKKKSNQWLYNILLIAFLFLAIACLAPGVWAQEDDDDDDDGPAVLEDAKVIIETNFTDGDAGVQVFLDGEGWKKMAVNDPNGKKLFNIKAQGNLKKELGLTELFWESEEPEYLDPEELTLQEILELFPEGEYKFKGKTVEGDSLTGTATLSHDLPCAPENLSPSEETVDDSGIVISWDPVDTALNDIGDACSADILTVETYQIIVEDLDSENEFNIFLPAESADNEVTIPVEFIEDGKTYKYEVLAIADNGNQTIAETYFCTGTVGDPCDEPDD